MTAQTTINSVVEIKGIGLHSGQDTNVRFCPAELNSGIIFEYSKDSEFVRDYMFMIKAIPDQVYSTNLGTSIKNYYGIKIQTIEHVMSALYGLGIDNILIEVNNSEIPILDGSSFPFYNLLKKAGIKKQNAKNHRKNYTQIITPFLIHQGNSYIQALPTSDNRLVVDMEIDFPNSIIGKQTLLYDSHHDDYATLISKARTFAFEHEIKTLQANDLALGGSLDNAIVVGKDKILNESGLRYPDEFVRHKMLDFLGDLYLAGNVSGHFIVKRPGHTINTMLAKELINHSEQYDSDDLEEDLANFQ